MQLDFDLGVFFNKLVELLGLQSEHVTVGKCLGTEDGGKQLPVVADILCCMPTHLHQVQQVLFRQHALLLAAQHMSMTTCHTDDPEHSCFGAAAGQCLSSDHL